MLALQSGSRLAATVCACGLSAFAQADAPALTLVVTAGEIGRHVSLNPNSDNEDGVGQYSGLVFATDSAWSIDYDLHASSWSRSASQHGSLVVRNLANRELDFSIVLSLPVAADEELAGCFHGAFGGSLTTQGAGYLASISGVPLWMSSTQGLQTASLYTEPFTVTRSFAGSTSLGGQSFGGSQPSLPAQLFGTNLAIALNFRLSAGATANFTTSFSGIGLPVPAPGALALLAAAGLFARRRRR